MRPRITLATTPLLLGAMTLCLHLGWASPAIADDTAESVGELKKATAETSEVKKAQGKQLLELLQFLATHDARSALFPIPNGQTTLLAEEENSKAGTLSLRVDSYGRVFTQDASGAVEWVPPQHGAIAGLLDRMPSVSAHTIATQLSKGLKKTHQQHAKALAESAQAPTVDALKELVRKSAIALNEELAELGQVLKILRDRSTFDALLDPTVPRDPRKQPTVEIFKQVKGEHEVALHIVPGATHLLNQGSWQAIGSGQSDVQRFRMLFPKADAKTLRKKLGHLFEQRAAARAAHARQNSDAPTSQEIARLLADAAGQLTAERHALNELITQMGSRNVLELLFNRIGPDTPMVELIAHQANQSAGLGIDRYGRLHVMPAASDVWMHVAHDDYGMRQVQAAFSEPVGVALRRSLEHLLAGERQGIASPARKSGQTSTAKGGDDRPETRSKEPTPTQHGAGAATVETTQKKSQSRPLTPKQAAALLRTITKGH